MLEAKANIQLDGQEIALLIKAAISKSKVEALIGNHYRADQYQILADKLGDAKEQFHKGYSAVFSERYGLQNEEKPALAEQTFRG